jgi:dimeric dUTPase (all-alpha-NTP-PPase superfamily)
MASSSGGSGSGIHRSDHWESAVEGRSSAKASSSSGPEPLSSSIDTEQDASIDTAASQDHSASTRRLWSAVKVSAKLAGAHRRAKEDDLSAFDAEGMSDPAGNRSSGAYLEQWNSIAHFLDEDEDELRNRDQQKGPSRRRERKKGSRMGEDDMNHASLTEEPESMLSSNPDEIPRQEDPLSYASGTMLLDTESESSGDEAYDTCTETGGGKASQSRLGSQVKNIIHKRPSPFIKTVFKCVLAYFVASLFTYSPYLSHRMALMLPNHDHSDKVPISNLHLIATVSVYFHPGRSMGSMVEASIYAMAGFLYSIFLGVASMLLAVFLHDQNLPLTSNFLTVVVFVGIGMALVGYAKVKIGRPNFNTACSLIGVITFTVIVSEGSTHLGRFSAEKIWQVTLVVFVGTLISNIICFAIWPTSACTSLQADIQRNLESFSTLLKVLTKTFLLDDMKEFNIRSHRIKEAIDDHHASFISLKKNLAEAKLEVPFDVRIRGRVSSYVRVVDSLNVLAQHLGGLRSSCGLQHEMIITQRARQKRVSDDKDFAVPHMSTNGSDDNSSHNGGELDGQSAAFRQFLNNVGPQMRSLVFTCSRTLKSVTAAFAVGNTDQKGGEPVTSYDSLASDVSAALKRFQHEQTVAIKKWVYNALTHPLFHTDAIFTSDCIQWNQLMAFVYPGMMRRRQLLKAMKISTLSFTLSFSSRNSQRN